MAEVLTRVQLAFYPEHLNWWLRFGEPDRRILLDRRRAVALFRPGQVFGYVRWQASEYGTQTWRFTIVRAAKPSVMLSRIDGVYPGGEVLLLAVGSAKVMRALKENDKLEAAGFEPADVSSDYFRHLHNRIAIGRPARPYTRAEHDAYLAARKVRR